MANISPASVRFIFDILKQIGLVDFHVKHNREDWKAVLWQLFGYFQHVLAVLFLVSNVSSTLCRSSRHVPEFCQRLFESCIILMGFICTQIAYHRYEDIKSIVHFMETSLSNANKEIANKYKKKANITLFAFLLTLVFASAAHLSDKLHPLSEKDIAELKIIYGTQNPERRHYVNVWIPYVDETLSWHYAVIHALEFWPTLIAGASFYTIGVLVLTTITVLEGQYTILRTYVKKLGRQHTDIQGNTVYYTNIERNKYIVEPINKRTSSVKDAALKAKLQQRDLQRHLVYEKLYFRQVLKFHQKLVILQTKVR
uniref:Odorant receptor n=1 Tax=Cacopsylla melanoneura TaxID=428564 RepID=A0A8D8LUN5_9HEMI